jgi:alpha-D-xyloside xylohydrolase
VAAQWTVAIPFLTLSKGYGILWDNTALTRFGDLREFKPIPPAQLFDTEHEAGGLTGFYFSGDDFRKLAAKRKDSAVEIEVPTAAKDPNLQIHPDLPPNGNVSVRWEGEVASNKTGDYLFQTCSNNGIKLWINDQLVIAHWRQGRLPWKNIAKVHLEAGKRYLKTGIGQGTRHGNCSAALEDALQRNRYVPVVGSRRWN